MMGFKPQLTMASEDKIRPIFIPIDTYKKIMEGRATDRELLQYLRGMCVVNQNCDWAFTELSPNEEFAEIQKMIEWHLAQ